MNSSKIEAEPREWLIRKRGYYYRPNRAGYTSSPAEAGRYTEAEAKAEAAIEPSIMSAVHQSEVAPPSRMYPESKDDAANAAGAAFRKRWNRNPTEHGDACWLAGYMDGAEAARRTVGESVRGSDPHDGRTPCPPESRCSICWPEVETSASRTHCPYCQRPASSDGTINHAAPCAGLETIELNRLQYDTLRRNGAPSECVYTQDGDSAFFDTGCGNRWHRTPGLELYPHCAWCGGKVAEHGQEKSPLKCPECGADRTREPCGRSFMPGKCPMGGTAQGDSDGPGEEDGPWAEGWEERSNPKAGAR